MTCRSCLLSGEEGEVRSVLQEQSTALGLGMFALLVQRCTELLKEIPAGTHSVRSTSRTLGLGSVTGLLHSTLVEIIYQASGK